MCDTSLPFFKLAPQHIKHCIVFFTGEFLIKSNIYLFSVFRANKLETLSTILSPYTNVIITTTDYYLPNNSVNELLFTAAVFTTVVHVASARGQRQPPPLPPNTGPKSLRFGLGVRRPSAARTRTTTCRPGICNNIYFLSKWLALL